MVEEYKELEFRPDTKKSLEEVGSVVDLEKIDVEDLVVSKKTLGILELLSLIDTIAYKEDQGKFNFILDPKNGKDVRQAYRRVIGLLLAIDGIDDLLIYVEDQEADKEKLDDRFDKSVENNHEEARVKLLQLRSLISISYIDIFKENGFFNEFDQEQLEEHGFLDKIETHGFDVKTETEHLDQIEEEIKDLLAEAEKYLVKLKTTDDPDDPNYFDPSTEKLKTKSGADDVEVILYFRLKIDHYRKMFGASSLQINLKDTARIQKLERESLSRVDQITQELEIRQIKIEETALESWKTANTDYSAMMTEILSYESPTPPIVLDGSIDTTQNIIDFKAILVKARAEAETSIHWAKNESDFQQDLSRAEGIFAELEMSLYLFMIQPFMSKLREVEELDDEEINSLGTSGKKELYNELASEKNGGGINRLDLSFFAVNVGDIYGTSVVAENIIQAKIRNILERYGSILKKLEIAKLDTAAAQRFMSMSLEQLMRGWHVGDVIANDELRYALEQIILDKLTYQKKNFINQAISTRGKKTEEEAILEGEERFENFKNLILQAFGLNDFGMMSAGSLNTLQGTCVSEQIIGKIDKGKVIIVGASNKDGCMALNEDFNKNPLVGAIDVDPAEMYTKDPDDMGVIQMIVFAAYQKMRQPKSEEDGGYSRNYGYTSQTMTNLIEHVSGQDHVEMWDEKPKPGYDLDISSELENFPENLRPLILMIARWKLSRDDCGSLAGIWGLGHDKSAMKKGGIGGASAKPGGVGGALCYAVGKNEKTDFHLSTLEIYSPENTLFIKDHHKNNALILLLMEQTDRFVLNKYPWLNDFMYEKVGGRVVGKHKYIPDKWHKDFPKIDEFVNQTEGSITGTDYQLARDAMLTILELSGKAHLIELSSNMQIARRKARVLIQNFSTNIAMVFAYVGPYKEGSSSNKYNYVSEFILAAYKNYLVHLMMAIQPVGGQIGRIDYQPEYNDLFETIRSTVESVLESNGSLKGYFHEKLIDKNNSGVGFLHEIPKKKYRDPATTKEFTSWQVGNIPDLMSLSDSAAGRIIRSEPDHPVRTGGGWSSSYEDDAGT